ncbi:hypothetical protein SmJEL517_g02427 [Synchytrium microbalum]|uniref:BTB domain-containing protein n=1 Tax=Synchytrium microbalum TaxID=1806994 RepID=A0A507C5W3_9FUNG|nr:uncharacterized protein SmJEL517_g02427 [Synchytrium microbalum]TPX35032.1 hypothetical protein SmJEL517_g02427 [Synchytrium microbalum]
MLTSGMEETNISTSKSSNVPKVKSKTPNSKKQHQQQQQQKTQNPVVEEAPTASAVISNSNNIAPIMPSLPSANHLVNGNINTRQQQNPSPTSEAPMHITNNTSSSPSPNMMQPPQPSYNDILCSHMYRYGFIQGLYSDLTVFVRLSGDQVVNFKLHKILAIRSPLLNALIQQQDNGLHPQEITLPMMDPNFTYEGLSVAFGYLYGSYSEGNLASPTVSSDERSIRYRATLAAAVHLQLNELASSVTNLIKNEISRMTLVGYCAFLLQTDLAPYQQFAQEIRDAVFTYLAKGSIREAFECTGSPIPATPTLWPKSDTEPYRVLVSIFCDLPFEWLKRVVESKSFDVPSGQERYIFAKEVIQRRAKGLAIHTPPGEENVLLAFGGGDSGISIVRKSAAKGGMPQMRPGSDGSRK